MKTPSRPSFAVIERRSSAYPSEGASPLEGSFQYQSPHIQPFFLMIFIISLCSPNPLISIFWLPVFRPDISMFVLEAVDHVMGEKVALLLGRFFAPESSTPRTNFRTAISTNRRSD
jgi:hypothetical protein